MICDLRGDSSSWGSPDGPPPARAKKSHFHTITVVYRSLRFEGHISYLPGQKHPKVPRGSQTSPEYETVDIFATFRCEHGPEHETVDIFAIFKCEKWPGARDCWHFFYFRCLKMPRPQPLPSPRQFARERPKYIEYLQEAQLQRYLHY